MSLKYLKAKPKTNIFARKQLNSLQSLLYGSCIVLLFTRNMIADRE